MMLMILMLLRDITYLLMFLLLIGQKHLLMLHEILLLERKLKNFVKM